MSAQFPGVGTPGDRVLADLRELTSGDAGWQEGRTWAFVYPADPETQRVAEAAYAAAAPLNALGARSAFPSLGTVERELVAMQADLLHAPQAHGHVTSGGSESIFLAVQCARESYRRGGGTGRPALVVPSTVHPAFDKAAHYLDLEVHKVPVGPDMRADVAAMSDAVDDRTAMLVGSAPSYPHGVVDPIAELGALASSTRVWLHVDACVGGFVLPFLDPAQRSVPPFDFRVSAVRSMSLDAHKYGYALKGVSTLLHRDAEGAELQRFRVTGWPGGLYETPNLSGTRPGAPMASAWAVIRHLGRPGFERLVARAVGATDRLRAGIETIPGFSVPCAPDATLLAFASDRHDLGGVAEALRHRGWVLGVQGPPSSIHLTVSPVHAGVVEQFVADLTEVSAALPAGGSATEAPRYA